jgi:hypothetical protein
MVLPALLAPRALVVLLMVVWQPADYDSIASVFTGA